MYWCRRTGYIKQENPMTPDHAATLATLRDAPPDSVRLAVLGAPDLTARAVQAAVRALLAAQPAARRPATKPAVLRIGTAGTLLAAVRRVMRALPSVGVQKQIPVLGCIRITVLDGIATLTATDAERALTEKLVLPVPDCDGIAHATALQAPLLAMPASAPVNLATVSGGWVLGDAVLPAGVLEDFPVVADIGETRHFTLPANALRRMLSRTAHAISADETRYYLNGVFLHAADTRLRAVATDGHRMVRVDTRLPSGADDALAWPDASATGIIVPRAAVADLLALLPANNANVAVFVGKTRMRVTFGDIVLATKLVDGTFPDYRRVIPARDESDHVATVDRAALITAVKAARAAFTRDDGPEQPVKLEFDGATLRVSASAASGGRAARDVPFAGEAVFAVGVQARYLLDAAAAVTGDAVFRFTAGEAGVGAPFVIYDTADNDVLEVVMPIRI
jgi:DNA polymerase-3 subunit beta